MLQVSYPWTFRHYPIMLCCSVRRTDQPAGGTHDEVANTYSVNAIPQGTCEKNC